VTCLVGQKGRRCPATVRGVLGTRITDSLERLASLGLQDPQPSQVLNDEKVEFALYTEWDYSVMDTADLCHFVYSPLWQNYTVQWKWWN